MQLDRRVFLTGLGALAGCGPDRVTERKPKGGIGGTGIVRMLTDFGSLLVNGLKIRLPADLPIETALGAMGQDALAVGQALTIEAASEDGLTARRVHIAHPVIGVLEDRDGALSVAGVRITPEQGAQVTARPGARVAVSGTWDQTRVVASRIDPMPGQGAALAGTLRRLRNGWSIGAMPVRLPDDAVPLQGAYATAVGRPARNMFVAETLSLGRFTGAAGDLTALSVEGFLSPTTEAPFHTVDGLGHSLSADSQIAQFVGERVLLTGGYAGRFVVTRGRVLPQDLGMRRAALKI